MKINIKATNLDLTAAIKESVQEKIGSLEKYLNNILQANVEVGKTSNKQKKGDIFFCEVNLSVPGTLLRFRHEFGNLQKAIGEAKKGIQREIIKYKEKNIS